MCHIQMQSRFFKVNFADLDCTTLSTSSLSYIYSQKLCDYSSLLTAEDIWFKCDLYLQFYTSHYSLENLHWFEAIFKMFTCAVFEDAEVAEVKWPRNQNDENSK